MGGLFLQPIPSLLEASSDERWGQELVKVHKFSRSIGVPTHFVSLDDAKKLEPFIRAQVGILESRTTGIIDSHAYMQYLLGAFLDHGGDIAYHSTVTTISPLGDPAGTSGYSITTRDGSSGEESTFEVETLINSAGLGACAINNLLYPEPSHPKHRTPYFAKGNYFSYSASTPRASRLIYPAPEPGLGGLGTHLTLDISGALRFGPDVEWVESPADLSVTTSRLHDAVREIRKYMPDVDEARLHPDYAGIRPKLGRGSAVATGKGFEDFYIRDEGREELGGGGKRLKGFVNLLGIESPGLTASLAIAEEVEGLLYR
jgi:2-hydroxyglutarate dehydrogenase